MLLLIAAIECQEDRDLMTQFYDTNLNLLYHEARKLISTKEDVEDIVYEAFTRIIKKIDVFRTLQPKQRARYAVVTVRNLCYHHLRKENHFTIASFDELIGTADITRENEPERITEQQLFTEQIQRIIAQLDIEQRLLLEQKYILHWTDVEMAQMYGIESQSMRMKLTRARQKLLKEMKAQGFHPGDWLL